MAAACGPLAAKSTESPHVPAGPVPCVLVEREGDPETGLAASLVTEGIDDSARPAVALAALFRERLAAKWVGVVVVPSGDGLRISGPVTLDDAAATATALRNAISTPVAAPEIDTAKKALAALAHRPPPMPSATDGEAPGAIDEVTRCEGTPYFHGNKADLSLAELEAWRSAVAGEGRLAFGVVGSAKVENAASRVLIGGARWPRAAPIAPATKHSDGLAFVEASPLVPPGTARVRIAFRDPSAARTAAAAIDLADARGALASRLAALGTPRAPVDLREITATAHPVGGCLAVTLDVGGVRFAEDATAAAARVADAVVLARQEVSLGLENARAASKPAVRDGDPREAAAVVSWWALVHDDSAEKKATSVLVETNAAPRADAPAAATEALHAAVDRATKALGAPIAEARVRVERGQEDVWVLMASPCGTLAERSNDAGLGAAFVVGAALAGSERTLPDVSIEPWMTPDGLGIVAHGPRHAGETPEAQARRIADASGRAFAAQPIPTATLSLVRAALLQGAESIDSRAQATLAFGLFPDHPSWLDTRGTSESLARSSDGAILARGDDLRTGPIRVAVLANASAEQGNAAVAAADRWIARRSTGAHACGAPSMAAPARPGTYAIESIGRPPQVDLAFRLSMGDSASRKLASWWATILDGKDGLLASAVGGPGLARSWSAAVVGPDKNPALAVGLVSSDAALDSAVAQTRGLFDRLRQGAITQADLTRAQARRSKAALALSLDPRARLVALWTGAALSDPPPSLDALKTFAASTFRDDALVVVAARPPRIEESHEKTP